VKTAFENDWPVDVVFVYSDGNKVQRVKEAVAANCPTLPFNLHVLTLDCVFRPSRSAIPADADHPFRQGDHPGRDATG
jgi:hypothetical protein